jgi:hypothetical protein
MVVRRCFYNAIGGHMACGTSAAPMLSKLSFALAAACSILFLLNCGGDAATAMELAAIDIPNGGNGKNEKGGPGDGVTSGLDGPAANPDGHHKEWAEPLPATPPGEWTWFGAEHFNDIPRCMDGSKTGLGINRAPNAANAPDGTPSSKKVLVFMQGGGACFNGQTCAISDYALTTDHHNDADFKKWSESYGKANVMNRERAENPFRDWDFVMIPYCSGDVFAGDNATGFKGRPQLGYKNVSSYLPRLASTFRSNDQLVLTGMSAGGYGAAYNFVQVQKMFDWLSVTMIDDSGPNLGTKFTPTCLQQIWKETWHMDKTSPIEGPFPLGIDSVTGAPGAGLYGLAQSIISKYPKNKFAFISHERDLVMRYFHGIGHTKSCAAPGLLSGDFFAEGLREIRDIKGDNFSTFYGPGTGHPYFAGDPEMYDTTVDGMTLAAWLTKVVTTGDEPRRVPGQF